jgi:hypothetical protein
MLPVSMMPGDECGGAAGGDSRAEDDTSSVRVNLLHVLDTDEHHPSVLPQAGADGKRVGAVRA